MKNSLVNTERPRNIEVSFYETPGRHVARYVSGTIVREETLEHTRMIGLYWSASGQVQRENVTRNELPGMESLARPLHIFELEIDGQSLHNRWDWISGGERPAEKPGTVEAVIELRHQVRPITIKVITRLDGTSVLARWLEITNTGEAPAALSRVSPWSGLLWRTSLQTLPDHLNPSVAAKELPSEFTLGYFRQDQSDWGHEGNLVWQPLPREKFRFEQTAGLSRGCSHFIVKNEISGEIAFISLGWSGNLWSEFSCKWDHCLNFGTGPLGPAPLRVIAPGETVRTPETHLGLAHGDMDSAVASWHGHMRASVVPPRPAGKEMYTIAGRVVEEPDEWILKEIDIAAEMGVEAFMVDAGWYGDSFSSWWDRRGDWFEGSWMPGGVLGVADYARKKGLLFGLWHEAEAMSEDTRMFKEHPEWELQTDEGRRVMPLAPNVADPEVAKYIEDNVIRIIRDFKLDFYKIDYNLGIQEGGQTLRDGYAEHEAWRHYEAIYRIYDRVLKEFPDVALENCAGGGGRNDLGMMSRFHYSCESDFSLHARGIRAINAQTLFIPPEAICYYHNHMSIAHQLADLDTHLRVTLFATTIFVGFGAQDADRNTDCFRKTRRYIELGKTFCRSIMANRPFVYHHTPEIGLINPSDWCVLEYAARDKRSSYAGIFKLTNGQAEYLFRPRGLDVGCDYEVTLDNSGQKFRASGWELVNNGIRVTLDSALTSELLLFDVWGA